MNDQLSSTEFKKYSRRVRRMHPSFVHHLLLHTRDRIKPPGRLTGKRLSSKEASKSRYRRAYRNRRKMGLSHSCAVSLAMAEFWMENQTAGGGK